MPSINVTWDCIVWMWFWQVLNGMNKGWKQSLKIIFRYILSTSDHFNGITHTENNFQGPNCYRRNICTFSLCYTIAMNHHAPLQKYKYFPGSWIFNWQHSLPCPRYHNFINYSSSQVWVAVSWISTPKYYANVW